MKGYEETDTDKTCRGTVKHPSTVTVEEKWDQSYCDKTSYLYIDLFNKMQDLFTEAANERELSEEFRHLDDMDVSPTDNPGACYSRNGERKSLVPLSLTPRDRAKRNVAAVQVVNREADSSLDKLMVETEMVMRRTDNYDSSISSAMEDAVKYVIVNTTYDDELNLTVNEDSITVGEVQNETCVESQCKNTAECYLKEDEALGIMTARCRCLKQYEDIFPFSSPGEVCVEPCTSKYCSNAGTCLRNSTFLFRYCSCNDWRVGETCGVDMVGVLLGGGITIGILTIALLTILITAVAARRRRRRNEVSLERDIATPATVTPQIRGIHRLPSDSQVRIEHEPSSLPRVPPPRPLPPRLPLPERDSPEQSVRSEPLPVHRDPRSDVWFISQNIPRPRLSL